MIVSRFLKEIALSGMLLMMTSAATAQTATQRMRGTVVDAINHEPVAYATIILTDYLQSNTTF